MKFNNYLYESFELIPRICFIYALGKRTLSFDWLWWGVDFDLRNKKQKRIDKLKEIAKPAIPHWIEVERHNQLKSSK